jgi:hypothetical protein
MNENKISSIKYMDLTYRNYDDEYNKLAAEISNILYEGDPDVLLKYIKDCKETDSLNYKIALSLFNVVSAGGDGNLFNITFSKAIQYYGLYCIHEFIKNNCPSLLSDDDE